jgi:hypothetical protein
LLALGAFAHQIFYHAYRYQQHQSESEHYADLLPEFFLHRVYSVELKDDEQHAPAR